MAVIKAIPSQTLTFNTTENLVEGDFVKITGDMKVGNAGYNEESIGVVVVAPEMGLVTILINKPLIEVVAKNAVTAGQKVETIDAGQVQPLNYGGGTSTTATTDGKAVGIAVKGAVAGKKTFVAVTI